MSKDWSKIESYFSVWAYLGLVELGLGFTCDKVSR